MSTTINIAVGKSLYSISCTEEEKDKIKKLSLNLNKKVNEYIMAGRGSIDEKTALMLCALNLQKDIEDRSDAKEKDLASTKKNQDLELKTKDEIRFLEKLNNKIQSLKKIIQNLDKE